MSDTTLTAHEIALAHRRGIFTVTTETARGYRVVLFRTKAGMRPVRLAQSRECVRPHTARRYGEALVREALRR